jgi:hypothetical protein
LFSYACAQIASACLLLILGRQLNFWPSSSNDQALVAMCASIASWKYLLATR